MLKAVQKFFRHKLIIVSFGLLLFAGLFFIQQSDKNTIFINTNDKSPIEVMGGNGERIYLKFGIIYINKNDLNREYNVVDGVFHVTSEWYKQLVFFDTPEEAEAAGYKPSEHFTKDYECVKHSKDFSDCS